MAAEYTDLEVRVPEGPYFMMHARECHMSMLQECAPGHADAHLRKDLWIQQRQQHHLPQLLHRGHVASNRRPVGTIESRRCTLS